MFRGTLSLLVIFLCALAPLTLQAAEWPDVFSSPGVKADGGKDAAIIIGIEDYMIAPDVPGATQNAQDWYQYLTKSRKIGPENIELLRNNEGAIEMIRERAAVAASRVKRGGTLWVIFIGHGAPSKDGKDGLLVGVDAQQTASSLYARSLRQSELVEIVSQGKQARTMMIIDACFSGKTSDGNMLASNLQPLLLVEATSSSATILSAGGGGEFAGPLPGLARPAFSYLILGAMRGWGDADSDGSVTAKEAIIYAQNVIRSVVKDRTQTPQLRGPDQSFALSRGGKERGPDITAMVLGANPSKPFHVVPKPKIHIKAQEVPQAAPKPIPQGGQLEVMNIKPASATVFIDDYRVGLAPSQFLDLPLGRVWVTLRAAGYEEHKVRIKLKKGKLAELHDVQLKALPSILVVSANISGGEILVNGEVLGMTVGGRAVELKLVSGAAKVSIRRKGYQTHKVRVRLTPGDRVNVKAKLLLEGMVPKKVLRRPASIVEGHSPVLGYASAPVTIIEFADFQCPYCRKASSIMQKLVKTYPTKIKLIYKHLPLSFHKDAFLAAEASMAAHAQGKFWEFHDQLFMNPKELQRRDLEKYASKVGLNLALFKADLDSHKYRAAVERDVEEAARQKISGTPTFLINGQKVSGAQSFEHFKSVVAGKLRR